jgi:hypothetical protein
MLPLRRHHITPQQQSEDSRFMSLELFSAEEHQKLVDAERRYGNAFINAYNTTILVSNLMMWPIIDCDLFIRFYSQMKKYHALSVVSTVRLHRIQAKMDLRDFLESTANAAFSLAHTDNQNYFDLQNNRIGDAQRATLKGLAPSSAARLLAFSFTIRALMTTRCILSPGRRSAAFRVWPSCSGKASIFSSAIVRPRR